MATTLRQSGSHAVQEDAAAAQRSQNVEEGTDAAPSRPESFQNAPEGCTGDILEGKGTNVMRFPT